MVLHVHVIIQSIFLLHQRAMAPYVSSTEIGQHARFQMCCEALWVWTIFHKEDYDSLVLKFCHTLSVHNTGSTHLLYTHACTKPTSFFRSTAIITKNIEQCLCIFKHLTLQWFRGWKLICGSRFWASGNFWEGLIEVVIRCFTRFIV